MKRSFGVEPLGNHQMASDEKHGSHLVLRIGSRDEDQLAVSILSCNLIHHCVELVDINQRGG